MAKRRGRFIVFEGIDGSGTTTQVAKSAEWLRGQGELVHTTAEPTTGPIGALLRQVLSGRVVSNPGGAGAARVDMSTVALLFAADRLDHVQNEIEPFLARGFHVLCDRYVLSSLAYQGTEVDLKFVRAVNQKAPPPDLTIFLEVDPQVAMDRIAGSRTRRDGFENLAFQKQVAAVYGKVVGEWNDGRLEVLDGEPEPHVVSAKVRKLLEEVL